MIVDYSILFYRFYRALIAKLPDMDKYFMLKKIHEKLTGVAVDLNRSKFTLAADLGISFRKQIYPKYKKNRVYDAKLKKLYFDVLELFMQNGVNVLMYESLEADDICYLYGQKYQNAIIVSEDSDMDQVTMYGNKLYYPFKNCFYTGDGELSLFLKIMLGCGSDSIPRCVKPGVGKVTLTDLFYDVEKYEYEYVSSFKQLTLNCILCDFKEIDYSQFKFQIP